MTALPEARVDRVDRGGWWGALRDWAPTPPVDEREVGSRLVWPGSANRPAAGDNAPGPAWGARRVARRRRWRSYRPGLELVLLLGCVSAAWGATPQVEFDVALQVACRDVTPPEFAAAHPAEKLVEAVFDVSSLVRSGTQSELVEFLFRIESPLRTLLVADHLPRTELASRVVGPIAVEQRGDRAATVGAGVGAKYDQLVKGDLTAQWTSTSGTHLRYELLPPKELVAASGTLHRQRGVFFKLRPSGHSSLEGARQLVCVFRVPRTWRGDYVQVHCHALGTQRGVVSMLDRQVVAGRESFLVALYLEGDEVARQSAARFVEAQHRLEALAAAQPTLVAAAAYPQLPGWLASVRAAVEQPEARALAAAVLHRYTSGQIDTTALPPELHAALVDRAEAHAALCALAATSGVSAAPPAALRETPAAAGDACP